MKLVRHGQRGRERPRILDGEGRVRDLSSVCEDFNPAFFAKDGIGELRGVDVSGLPLTLPNTSLGSCVAQPGNFIAIGLNYIQHARETNAPIPKDPILFNKAPSCISGPFDPVILPRNSTKTDWEVELALVIGKETHCVDEADALSCVAGYFICNDVSEREFLLERSGHWVKGKMAPTFGPIGPWLVTSDDVPDPQNLAFVAGVERQAHPGFIDERHDLHSRSDRCRHQSVRAAPGRRHHHDRYAAGRWSRHEATPIPQAWRHDAPGHRRAWRAGPARRLLGRAVERDRSAKVAPSRTNCIRTR